MIYNSTGLELIFATVVIVVVAIIARRAYLAPERMNLFDLALLFYGIYFGFGPWVAFFYGGGTLPQEPAWLLVYSYTIIISFLFGLWLIGAASGTNSSKALGALKVRPVPSHARKSGMDDPVAMTVR